MNLDRLSANQLLQLAGIATPIAAVAVARFILGLGPNEAPAATTESTTETTIDITPETQATQTTDAQDTAMAYILEHAGDDPVRSPMVKPVAPPDAVESSNPEQLEPAQSNPTSNLVLTSIVGQGTRSFASLSGRVYRIGDTVSKGWRITTIDPAERKVIITSDAGDTRVLHLMEPLNK